MNDDDELAARRARAEERRGRMVIVKGRVGDEVDLHPVAGAEGFALVAKVSAAAWVFAGRPLPGPLRRPIEVEFRRRGP